MKTIRFAAALLSGAVCICLTLAVLGISRLKGGPALAQKAFALIWFWWAKRFLKLKVQGYAVFENAEKPILLISNHVGAIDAFLIGMAIPAKFKPIRVLAADWVLKDKALKFFLESLGAVPICRTDSEPARIATPASNAERSSAGWQSVAGERFSDPNKERAAKLTNLLNCAKRGQTILIFPQGRITPEGQFGDCRKGAAEIILAMPELTVVPIAVQGTQNLLFQTNPDSKKPRLNLENLKKICLASRDLPKGEIFCGEEARGVTITFGRPLDHRYLADKNKINRHLNEETLRIILTNEIKYQLIKLKKING